MVGRQAKGGQRERNAGEAAWSGGSSNRAAVRLAEAMSPRGGGRSGGERGHGAGGTSVAESEREREREREDARGWRRGVRRKTMRERDGLVVVGTRATKRVTHTRARPARRGVRACERERACAVSRMYG